MKILQIIGKEFILSHPSAAISYAKIVQLADTAKKTFRIVYTTLSYALLFIVKGRVFERSRLNY